ALLDRLGLVDAIAELLLIDRRMSAAERTHEPVAADEIAQREDVLLPGKELRPRGVEYVFCHDPVLVDRIGFSVDVEDGLLVGPDDGGAPVVDGRAGSDGCGIAADGWNGQVERPGQEIVQSTR